MIVTPLARRERLDALRAEVRAFAPEAHTNVERIPFGIAAMDGRLAGGGILCQGRGSVANSCVCFVLGITSIDPIKHELLFERFVSGERKEPPDIDVDFEAERREEVIQWIYETYGRDRSALTAVVTRFPGPCT